MSASNSSVRKTKSREGSSKQRTSSRSKSQGTKSLKGGSNRSTSKSVSRDNYIDARMYDEQDDLGYALKSEITAIVLIAAAIALFLCNFGLLGAFGNFLSEIMFGLFGLLAFVMPLIVGGMVVFYISNHGSIPAVRKILSCIGLTFIMGIVFELVSGRTSALEFVISDIYQSAAIGHNGGGVLFGSIAYLLDHTFSLIGTVLILIVAASICLVVLTEKSLIRGVRKGTHMLKERAYEDAAAYSEQVRVRRMRLEERREAQRREKELLLQQKEDEKILRMDHYVSGVDTNTDLRASGDFEDSGTMSDDDGYLDEPEYDQEEEIMEEPKPEPRIHTSFYVPDNSEVHDDIHEITFNTSYEEQADAGYRVSASDNRSEDTQTYKAGFNEDVKADSTLDAGDVGIVSSGSDAPSSQTRNEIYAGTDLKFEQMQTEVEPDGQHRFTGKLKAHLPEDDSSESSQDDILIHAGGRDYGNGISEEGYGIHAQDHVSASRSTQKIDSMAKEPSYMPGEISYSNGAAPSAASGSRNEMARPAFEGTGSDTSLGSKTAQTATASAAKPPKKYKFPPTSLLKPGMGNKNADSAKVLKQTAAKLEKTLKTFGVNVTITDISQGPTVTRYELQPEVGVKVSKIVNLQDDIKLNLAATDIRIEAPIPGKAAVGIEVPNKENVTVSLRELLESREFKESKADLSFAVGKDIGGKTIVTDIAKMPHVLIAGATGSGKSVCINTMILSIIYKAKPEDVRLIMIDPKVVELSVYNGIPHLLIPVVTDPKKAAAALNWAVAEMTRRYKYFAEAEVRDLKGYNEYVEAHMAENESLKKLPKIVIIVDELADLMMVSANEVEEAICRLAQLARACGIHLVIATQRPSVDVITGLIKANMPSRIAFAVSSGTDSRTILDMVGAEKLLGKGDMLFYPQSVSKPVRLQGAFVSDSEISQVTDYIKADSQDDTYDTEIQEAVQKMEGQSGSSSADGSASGGPDRDEYFADAGRFIIDKEKASIGNLQRVFKIGFNRAARIMDQLCEAGVVGEEEGTKPRKVLMSKDEFESLLNGSK